MTIRYPRELHRTADWYTVDWMGGRGVTLRLEPSTAFVAALACAPLLPALPRPLPAIGLSPTVAAAATLSPDPTAAGLQQHCLLTPSRQACSASRTRTLRVHEQLIPSYVKEWRSLNGEDWLLLLTLLRTAGA